MYLDHAGATLYSEQQLRAVTEHLALTLYGNPRTPHLLFMARAVQTKMRCRSRLLLTHVRPPNHVCVCVARVDSQSPSSANATKMVAAVRQQVLNFFNASAKDYSVVFTGGATAGLKMVLTSWPALPFCVCNGT